MPAASQPHQRQLRGVWLVGGPLLAAPLTYGVDFLPLTEAQRSTFWYLVIFAVKLAALVGALLAALAFERSDYLRKAWLLIGGNYGLLLAIVLLSGTARPLLFGLNAIHLPGVTPGSHVAVVVRSFCLIGANLSAVIGTWLLARAWKVAGLDAGRPGLRWIVILAGLALAVVLSGLPAYADFVTLIHTPRWGAADGLASELGDFLTFALVAPLLLTALALRGGALGWPWALYTSSQLCWMLFDAAANLSNGTWVPHADALADALRVAACLLGLSSGIAQKKVLA